MIMPFAEAATTASNNPDPLLPTGVGAGGMLGLVLTWNLWLRDKILGERPNITLAEWNHVRRNANKVPRLVTHARNMHKAMKQVKEHLDNDEHAEAKAAIRMAENLSDSHFTDDALLDGEDNASGH